MDIWYFYHKREAHEGLVVGIFGALLAWGITQAFLWVCLALLVGALWAFAQEQIKSFARWLVWAIAYEIAGTLISAAASGLGGLAIGLVVYGFAYLFGFGWEYIDIARVLAGIFFGINMIALQIKLIKG